MNTIPTIFNENIIPYTAVGGKERVASTGISAVVLNRPGFPHRSFFQDIEKTGFDHVISIESASPHYDIEELAGRFPFVRFILPEKEINLGEQINLAASEIDSPLFFVFYSDMKIIAGGSARRMAERLSFTDNNEDQNETKTGFKRLCTVPVIINSNYEPLPTIVSPVTKKRIMRTTCFEPQNEGDFSLYPFNGIGIYDRERFVNIGGYDSTINNVYWQLLDFGFRSFLWGEEISLSLQLKLCYDADMPIEDFTVEENYRRFKLKNLAPVYRSNYAHLPYYRFLSYFAKSGDDIFNAWKEFKEGRRWVIKNKYRWKIDTKGVINLWEPSNNGHGD
ncbi:MAG: hypothetical protein LBU88_05820 [Treponema sp.]|nr:hypothetical protein [Treponema sp.]